MQKTFLVTGGAGFIGSAVIRELINNTEHRVINIDKLTYAGNLESLTDIDQNPRYTFIKADICDANAMQAAFNQHQPDIVMHLAAESHVDRSIDGPADFIQTNIVGTSVLLETARTWWSQLDTNKKANFRFHHISTDEVYGDLYPPSPFGRGEGGEGSFAKVGEGSFTTSKPNLFTETTPYNPSSPYSASKASSDHLVRAWHRTYGLPIVITNCSNNYGPYQFPEKLIPLMILNALEGKPLPVYGNGQQIRDWLYVEDHARALILVANQGKTGETYNIGGHNEKTNLEVVQAICELLDELSPSTIPPHRYVGPPSPPETSDRPEGEGVISPSPQGRGVRGEGQGQGEGHTPTHTTLITHVKDRPGHDQRYAIDASKIQEELGWTPEETFETGLKKTVEWFLSNQLWWTSVRSKHLASNPVGMRDK